MCSTPLTAQWFHYPTKDVPRKADGSVDMTAPAPRLADGHPDFSGIWAGEPKSGTEKNPIPDEPINAEDIRSGHHMSNIGVDLPGGKLPYQAWQLPIVKERTENLAIDDPHIQCFPDNFIRAYNMPHLLRYVQTPDLLVMLNELNAGYRLVFTDGRPLPVDPNPNNQGYSTAKWSDDGDTLIVDSNGFRNDTWIDWNGSVITEAAKVREEIRRPDFGHLEIKVTVDDPGGYAEPWTVLLRQRIVVDTELVDEICLENEQSLQHLK